MQFGIFPNYEAVGIMNKAYNEGFKLNPLSKTSWLDEISFITSIKHVVRKYVKRTWNAPNYKIRVLTFVALHSLPEWDHYKAKVPESTIKGEQYSGSSINSKKSVVHCTWRWGLES